MRLRNKMLICDHEMNVHMKMKKEKNNVDEEKEVKKKDTVRLSTLE